MIEITKALAKAQSEFPEIKKDKDGQEGNRKYKYANLHSILKAVTPILTANGFALVQTLEEKESGMLVLVTVLWHESGEKITSSVRLPDPSTIKAKEFGGFITYFRRYAIAPILGIEADEDLDSDTEPKISGEKRAARKTSATTPGVGVGSETSALKSNTELADLWKKIEAAGWSKTDAQKVCGLMFNKKFMELQPPEIKLLGLAVKKGKMPKDLLD